VLPASDDSAQHPINVITGRDEASTTEVTNMCFCIVLFLGYFCVTIFCIIADVPILKRKIVNHRIENPNLVRRDPTAFNAFIIGSLVFGAFVAMDFAHFGASDWYCDAAIMIFVPWALACIRNYISVPETTCQEQYVLIFETLTSLSSVRNNLILVSLSLGSLYRKYCRSLMLLNIFTMSSVLGQCVCREERVLRL
jgi:hypothetical protein